MRHVISAAINPNGQYHSDWVGEAGQVHACAHRRESENVVAERHNLNLRSHSVDDALKRKSSLKKLEKGALQNCD